MLSLGLTVTSSLTSVDALVRGLYSAGGILPRVALDFDDNKYVTDVGPVTFADAFTGNNPKLTYATTSNSTMVNSAGHLVWAPHNLLTYSEDFTYATWSDNPTITPNATAPDGSLNAYSYTHTATFGERIAKAVSVGSAITTTFAVYAKASTNAQWLRFFFHSGQTGTGDNVGAWFDLLNGNTGTTGAAGAGTLVSTDISDVGNGWYRCSVTGSVASSTSYVGFMYLSDADNSTTRDNGSTVLFYGAHVYRSDLGGMAPVPGAATGFEYYVPTNGAAKYLPRVGHHAYNGSAWVNEGLLIESDPRTNLVTYSDFSSGWTEVRASLNTTTQAGPDGVASSSVKLVASTDNDSHFTTPGAVASGNYAVSVFAKAAEYSWLKLTVNDGGFPSSYFDLSGNGVIGAVSTGITPHIESVGNGWFRCSVVNDTSITQAYVEVTTGDATPTFAGDGTSGIYLYGAQLEEGSTPSSYIPTSGSTVTRGGQSLVVPPAEFGWPEPEYIGPELADGSQLDKRSGTDGTVSRAGGIISFTPAASGLSTAISEEITGLTVGKVYEFRGRARSLTAGVGLLQLRSGSGGGGSTLATSSTSFATSFADCSIIYKATGTSVHLSYLPAAGQGIEIVEASHSFREINPLSVSIQMDGRMTYADEGVTTTARFTRWNAGGGVYIEQRLDTASTDTGRMSFAQQTGGAYDSKSVDIYTPGTLVPFNIASRHGSTFINGAVDGVALTADTTPTALPDLSGTNLQVAHDFMGTIRTFRQFAGDIGDAGLVTATS